MPYSPILLLIYDSETNVLLPVMACHYLKPLTQTTGGFEYLPLMDPACIKLGKEAEGVGCGCGGGGLGLPGDVVQGLEGVDPSGSNLHQDPSQLFGLPHPFLSSNMCQLCMYLLFMLIDLQLQLSIRSAVLHTLTWA